MTHRMARAQRGVTMLVVLVLLSAMLMGGLALARLTEVGTMASGNSSFREVSLQASEIGVNEAFAQVRGLPSDDVDTGGWYFATEKPLKDGVPDLDWDAVPKMDVGAYEVRYVAERMCTTTPVVERTRECLVRVIPQIDSRGTGGAKLDPPSATQFRITVQIIGPKGTMTWVQSLVTRS